MLDTYYCLVQWLLLGCTFDWGLLVGAITGPYTGQCILKQCPKGQKFQYTSPFRPCSTDLRVFGAVGIVGLCVLLEALGAVVGRRRDCCPGDFWGEKWRNGLDKS